MQNKYLLGIDIGTYSSKGIIIDLNGRLVASISKNNQLLVNKPEYAEYKKDVWWKDICYLAHDLTDLSNIESRNLEGIGCSAITPALLA